MDQAPKRDEISETRLSPLTPMLNMVRIEKVFVMAPRKDASSVTREQGASYSRRNCSAPLANNERVGSSGSLLPTHSNALSTSSRSSRGSSTVSSAGPSSRNCRVNERASWSLFASFDESSTSPLRKRRQ